MNKKYLILGAALLMLGGCTKPAVVSDVANKVEEKKEEAKKSIKDLVASGVSQKCNWKSDSEGSVSEGQMWISGKKFKQEIKTIPEGSKTESKVVVVSDGSYTYMWNTEMGKKGIKMAVTEDETQDYSAENGKVDWNKEFQFECNPTVVNDSELAPPADIEFQDLGVQLQQLQQLQEKYGQGE